MSPYTIDYLWESGGRFVRDTRSMPVPDWIVVFVEGPM